MGLRLSRSAEISLQDCRVPVENRLGEEGQGLRIAFESLDGGRVGIASQSVGLAQGALEAAAKYAKQRKTFGQPIAEYQAIQWMLADMQTEIEAARALTHYAAWMRDSGAPAAKSRRTARSQSKTVRQRNGQPRRLQSRADSRQRGYSRETDVERYYRDARVLTIYEGTSEISARYRPRSAARVKSSRTQG